MNVTRAAALLLPLSLSGCLLYTNIKVPRGYRTAVPAEVKAAADDPAAAGSSCNRSALWLVSWGDASYARAAERALAAAGRPDGILYDVRADVKVDAYLVGLYSKVCTNLSGKAAKP